MYYFAYGSNMCLRRLEARKLEHKLVAAGSIDNWRIRFNKMSQKEPSNGFANIEPYWGDRVWGAIFEVMQADLPILDKFEGYPGHYQRTTLFVESNGVHFPCVVYIATHKWSSDTDLNVTNEYAGFINEGITDCLGASDCLEYADKLKTLML